MPTFLKKHVKSQRAQSTVEFTFVAFFFFALFFAVIEFSHLFYVRLTLQHALKEAGRFMVTGQGGDVGARKKAIQGIFEKWLIGTGAGLQSFAMDPPDGGKAGDTVKLTATFIKPWFTGFIPAGPITFSLSNTWKNEPFS